MCFNTPQAALASLLLKEHVGIADLRCFAFATPPCADLSTAVRASSFVTSVVNCDDVVPRAALHNGRRFLEAVHVTPWRQSLPQLTAALVNDQLDEAEQDDSSPLRQHAAGLVRKAAEAQASAFGASIASVLESDAGEGKGVAGSSEKHAEESTEL